MFCAAAEAISDWADKVSLEPLLNVYNMTAVSARLTPGEPRVDPSGLLRGQGHVVLTCINQKETEKRKGGSELFHFISFLLLFVLTLPPCSPIVGGGVPRCKRQRAHRGIGFLQVEFEQTVG